LGTVTPGAATRPDGPETISNGLLIPSGDERASQGRSEGVIPGLWAVAEANPHRVAIVGPTSHSFDSVASTETWRRSRHLSLQDRRVLQFADAPRWRQAQRVDLHLPGVMQANDT
jgi:hypothetical protein